MVVGQSCKVVSGFTALPAHTHSQRRCAARACSSEPVAPKKVAPIATHVTPPTIAEVHRTDVAWAKELIRGNHLNMVAVGAAVVVDACLTGALMAPTPGDASQAATTSLAMLPPSVALGLMVATFATIHAVGEMGLRQDRVGRF